jgi:hypothetical protein
VSSLLPRPKDKLIFQPAKTGKSCASGYGRRSPSQKNTVGR